MDYSWDIQTLKRYFAGDVVTNVRWECTATYNSASAQEDGSVDIPYLDPTASGFIPYNDLTQTEVWGWLNAQTSSFVSSSIQEQLSSSVDLKLNPPDPIIVYGLPW
jgi:hypothetical protein